MNSKLFLFRALMRQKLRNQNFILYPLNFFLVLIHEECMASVWLVYGECMGYVWKRHVKAHSDVWDMYETLISKASRTSPEV
jgi:hypothetical protein